MTEFIQAKTGYPLTVLFALWAAESAPTIGELSTVTRIPRNAVAQALRQLDGYVTQEVAGRWPRWTLTQRARQMRLPGLLPEPATVRPGRQIGETDFTASTIGNSDARQECISPVVVVVDQTMRSDISQQQQQTDTDLMHAQRASDEELDDVLTALDLAGIAEPTRSQLAADPWVTADRVRRIAQRAAQSGGRTGVIVNQLRAHITPPDDIEASRARARQDDDRRNVGYQWQAYLEERGRKR